MTWLQSRSLIEIHTQIYIPSPENPQSFKAARGATRASAGAVAQQQQVRVPSSDECKGRPTIPERESSQTPRLT